MVSIILLILFILPIIFQIIIGNQSIMKKTKLRYGMVCTLCIVWQIVATISILVLMYHNQNKSGINDGLGFLFLEVLGMLMIAVIVITIGIQLIFKKVNQRAVNRLE